MAMSSKNTSQGVLALSQEDFTASLVHLYSGPLVKIRIGSGGKEYKLYKNLLCKQSEYFAAMFEGKYREGVEQLATLEEVDGVISVQSFEHLVQWIYTGRISFGTLGPEDRIAAALELARIADMFDVRGIESTLAEQIETTIYDYPPRSHPKYLVRDPEINTRYTTVPNIKSASNLPPGHAVRGVLVNAAVRGYLQRHNNDRFIEEMKEIPGFELEVTRAAIKAIKARDENKYVSYFTDPISKWILPVQNPSEFY